MLKRIAGVQSVWILMVLVVIVAFFSITGGSSFFSGSNFTAILLNLAVLAVVGVGMTFVIITSGIDLSVGSVLVFASVISAKVMEAMGGQGWGAATVGIIVAILGGGVWGLINGILVAKAKIPPLIVTLGTLSIALSAAQIVTDGLDIRSVPRVLTEINLYDRILGLPALAFVALIVVIIGGIILHRTKFGRYTYAIGSNEEAARRVGVRVDRHLVFVYLLSGLLAGLGAVLYLMRFGTTTISGNALLNLNVITAVVIGGTSIFGGVGSMFGTVVGLFIPAVLQAGLVIIGVQPFWQGVAVGCVLIAAVFVDQSRRAAAMRGSKRKKKPTTPSVGASSASSVSSTPSSTSGSAGEASADLQKTVGTGSAVGSRKESQ
ncbi:ABC transporter permease [Nakamurella sp. YIM 132087]|uniref:ABC transporter permease n=2 Tax=Nakamurella alba TaxID=2665158 RepID=A0A7K1FN82_9ACTN|nr:ABC transporter permease [Nakamurella alba]